MNNGQLHIYVKKSQITDEITPQDTGQTEVEKNDLEKNNFQQQAIISALINSGQQAISQGIQVYTQLTGDSRISRLTNVATNLATDVLLIAKGGVVGAIAVATKYTLGAVNSAVQTINTNREIEYNNSLLGSISTKGSRYY